MAVIPYGIGQKAQVTMGGNLAIDPLSVPNLELYLNSNMGLSALNHNDPVSVWPNQSSHGSARQGQQSTAALKPLFQKTSNLSPNGRPLVLFDGLNSPGGDTLNSPVFSVADSAAGSTFIAYGNISAPTRTQFPNYTALFSDRATRRSPALYYQSVDNNNLYAIAMNAGGVGTRYTFGTFAAGWQIVTWVISGAIGARTIKMYRNGVLLGTQTNSDQGGFAGGYDLGSDNGVVGGNGAMKANFGAFVWYSNALTDGIRLGVEKWIEAYFGLA